MTDQAENENESGYPQEAILYPDRFVSHGGKGVPYIAAGIATLGGLPPVLHLSDSQAVLPGRCRHGDLALKKTDTKVVRRLAVHRSIGSADSDAISTFSAERILPSIQYFAAISGELGNFPVPPAPQEGMYSEADAFF